MRYFFGELFNCHHSAFRLSGGCPARESTEKKQTKYASTYYNPYTPDSRDGQLSGTVVQRPKRMRTATSALLLYISYNRPKIVKTIITGRPVAFRARQSNLSSMTLQASTGSRKQGKRRIKERRVSNLFPQ